MKLPHSLRIVIFLLRVALGLNFFYLGFSALFNPVLGKEVRARSFSDLYAWLAAGPALGQSGWVQPTVQWAFLIIGICLVVGLFTRLASIVGIVLALLSYLPTVSFASLNIAQFISDEVIIVICLLIIIFSNTGNYLGCDTFIHIHPPKKV